MILAIFVNNQSKLLSMPYMPEMELPRGALKTCKSDQLYCAFKIFNKMSSKAYKQVNHRKYVKSQCRYI